MREKFCNTMLFFFAFFWAAAYSPRLNAQSLLECLGKEELVLHKSRAKGAVEQLNQRLVQEVALISDIQLTAQAWASICEHPRHKSSSVALLEAMMDLDPGPFVIVGATTNAEKEVQKNLVGNFAKSRGQLILDFMLMVQADVEQPDCLNKHFPTFQLITSKLKSLQEFVSPEDLDKAVVAEIKKMNFFNKFSSLQDKCKTVVPVLHPKK